MPVCNYSGSFFNPIRTGLDTGLIKPFTRLARKDKDRFNKKLLVFLFFLVVSTIFWFLSMLGKDYTTDMRYPVRYTNFPENKVLVGELPENLILNVRGNGYTLLRYRLSSRLLPIIFDVNSFSLNRVSDESDTFFILSSVAKSKISGQLGADIEINEILPDTLFFHFSEVVSRKLPVKADLQIEFRRQYMQSGPVALDPDTVTVSGPESVMDTLELVFTEPLAKEQVDRTVVTDVLLRPEKYLRFSEESVRVNVPVEQFTEASITVPIETVNVPEGFVLKIFPAEIRVSYLVPLSYYEKVRRQQFQAYVDYEILLKEELRRLPVNLSRYPDFIRGMRFSPQTVDFIIEK